MKEKDSQTPKKGISKKSEQKEDFYYNQLSPVSVNKKGKIKYINFFHAISNYPFFRKRHIRRKLLGQRFRCKGPRRIARSIKNDRQPIGNEFGARTKSYV
jgi:hypothetical protein